MLHGRIRYCNTWTSNPLNDIDEPPECKRRGGSPDGKMDHKPEGERVGRKQGLPTVGNWFGVEPISLIAGSLYLIQDN